MKKQFEERLGRELTDDFFLELLLAQATLILHGRTLCMKKNAVEEIREGEYIPEGYEGLPDYDEGDPTNL